MVKKILTRDRFFILTGMASITVWAWWYTVGRARAMTAMPQVLIPSGEPWTFSYGFMVFIMWVIMMIAMMLPSVTPMALVFASVHRKRREQQKPFVPTGFFLAGYLLAWAIFSLIATLLQALFHYLSFMSPTMESSHNIFAAMILLAAGIFQFTPLKRACLFRCQNPLEFVMTKWKEGKDGALRMGVHHGLFCIGCCWFLMSLLFVVGVMNIFWVAILALFVLLEKLIKAREWLRYMAGGALIIWAIYVFNP